MKYIKILLSTDKEAQAIKEFTFGIIGPAGILLSISDMMFYGWEECPDENVTVYLNDDGSFDWSNSDVYDWKEI